MSAFHPFGTRAAVAANQPIADIATVSLVLPMNSEGERYDIIKGTGPDNAFVELWDRSLAPGGLAFEAVAAEDGVVTVPFTVFEAFLRDARSYLRASS
jgi:hypothetical protein